MTASTDAVQVDGTWLVGCYWCGNKDGAELCFRGPADGPLRVACQKCGAVGAAPAATKEDAAEVWRHRVPAVKPLAPREVVVEVQLTGSAKAAAPRKVEERPDVLELLCRLLVGSSYKVPVEGRGSKPGLQSVDIAGAVGMMKSPLQRELALAVAQREPSLRSAPRLVRLAYARVAYTMQQGRDAPLDLRKGEDRHRLRIVIYDAAAELVFPEQKQPSGLLAKQAKMRKGNYLRAHKVATAELQATLNEARRTLGDKLFANWQADLIR